jgi:hypothetical protein
VNLAEDDAKTDRQDRPTFCRALARTAEPVFIHIRLGPGDQPVECFFNVRRYVEWKGGQLAYGRALSLIPLEA